MTLSSKRSRKTESIVTIGEYLTFLLPRLRSNRRLPQWPPDVFALCSSLLIKSGAYCEALTHWPPRFPLDKSPRKWANAIESLGYDWRIAVVDGKDPPSEIRKCWEEIVMKWRVPVLRIAKDLSLCHSILQLCAICDEASEGVGSPHEPDQNDMDARFHFRADNLLSRNEIGSTLCDEIHPTRARVLPKMHTPRNGLTIRSLSFYLALCTVEEVTPEWILVGSYPERESMNLLLIPWPFNVMPSQFEQTEPLKNELKNMPEGFGFFTFRQQANTDVVNTVKRLYERAVADMGRIDGVVLPEMALSPTEHEEVREFVLKQNAFLVCGVGQGSVSKKQHGVNCACLDLPHEEPLLQDKHHRWKLDSGQIRQYGVGSRLSVDKSWWEHLSLSDRRLLFVSVNPALVMCVLICEDLARPDPVGDLVRAVGPNLVIALLMDGPQLKGRWPERYAMALADDPGSSVLSVTSLGMAELSRPAEGLSRSRVVALWKDHTGGSKEIDLPLGCGAIVLSLSFQYAEEWTADGRRDYGAAVFPTLSGIHAVRDRPDSEQKIEECYI